ncbi:MAG: arylsulfatase, partial [Planctomycetota bacterium]
YIENGMVAVPATVVHRRTNLPNLDGWLWDNDEGFMSVGYDFENADKIFYNKTVAFIENHLAQHPGKPFFAVLSTQIAHAPVLPAKEFRGKTKGGPRGDFVWELDVLVGRLLDKLDELDVDENTLVLFNSDNGPETVHYHRMLQEYKHNASGPWRGMKRDGWGGGHRVPFIARWPRAIPAGQVSKQMTNTTDIFATLASIIGYELKEEDATDSFDMLPVMLGMQNEDDPVRPHMLTQSFRGQFQIRQGQWKYLDHMSSGGNSYDGGFMKQYLLPETAPNATGQLFHLGKDPGETTNLFFQESQKRKELQALLRNLKESGRSAPKIRKPIGIDNIPLVIRKAI